MRDVELRIDFRAALAKLVPAQLQGSWQLPTELTRLVIASGARSVDLEIKKSRLVIKAPGAHLDLVTLRDLGTLIDEKAPESERHGALVNLEERDGLALAALGGLPHEILELRSGSEHGWTLSAERGSRPRYERRDAPQDFELRLQGIRLDATAAEHWLQRNARFAPVRITVGGQRLGRGFRRPLIRLRLREPLPAALAVAERGEVPRLWLLRHGIISTRATVPGYPAFEAAVEMASVSAPGTTSAALREAVQPYLEPLVQAAVSLIGQLARHADSLRDEARTRASRLLLESARRERYRDLLKTIRIFPQIVSDGGNRRLVSIADLEYLIRFDDARTTRLDAIAPDQEPRDFALAGHQVLVLSSFERTLLGELLNVTFATPPTRPRTRRSLARIAEGLRGRLSFGWQQLWGHLVAEEDLLPSERTFLSTLRRAAQDGGLPRSAVFFAGDGRLHLTGDGQLLLPRRNPVVQASVRAVERDESWLYPVLVGLLGGHDLPAAELRENWRSGPLKMSKENLQPR